jgi:hypothetical protein
VKTDRIVAAETAIGAVDLALRDVKAVPTREDPRCARPS